MRFCAGLASLDMSLSRSLRASQLMRIVMPAPPRSIDPSQGSRILMTPGMICGATSSGAAASHRIEDDGEIASSRPAKSSGPFGLGSVDWPVMLSPSTLSSDRSHVAAVGLLRQPLRPQQIAQLRVRADDAEGDVAGGEFVMEIVQHARAGQIDVGRCREIADDQPDVDRSSARRLNTVSRIVSALM